MSLTAKIQTKNPISEWFNRHQSEAIDNIIKNANHHLQTTNPLQKGETLQSNHKGLVRSAAVYGLLKHIGYINGDKNWIANTYASKYIVATRGESVSFNVWFANTKTKSDVGGKSIISSSSLFFYPKGCQGCQNACRY
ncbi:hypothetical protein NIES4071_104130 (plasmid) [Calothrix sp. NIES-4071]|nr:hypothetical protein NIES4071_104130 [Calothrix sp. NIES-4071]BAZ64400.1 hypothetical protein NIES4105_101330 [Calothrix sp. NIES-4105]